MEMNTTGRPEYSEPFEAKKERVIDSLPETLGLVETDDMKRLRQLIAEAIAGGATDVLPQVFADYKRAGEALVELQTGESYTLAQVGLIIATGLLRRDAGRFDAAVADLDDALTYAENLGLSDEVIEALQAEIARLNETEPMSQAIADVLRKLGPEYGFDDETCAEIADLPDDEAFETAYGYLVQAGLDPDEVLADFLKLY